MNQILSRGKKIFLSEQTSIMSAATVIMAMTIASQVLGLVRQRVVLHFFNPTDAALFFAALRLPELLFEVLIYGCFRLLLSLFLQDYLKEMKKLRGIRRAGWLLFAFSFLG